LTTNFLVLSAVLLCFFVTLPNVDPQARRPVLSYCGMGSKRAVLSTVESVPPVSYLVRGHSCQ